MTVIFASRREMEQTSMYGVVIWYTIKHQADLNEASLSCPVSFRQVETSKLPIWQEVRTYLIRRMLKIEVLLLVQGKVLLSSKAKAKELPSPTPQQ